MHETAVGPQTSRTGGVARHAARARFSVSRHGRGAHGRSRPGTAVLRGTAPPRGSSPAPPAHERSLALRAAQCERREPAGRPPGARRPRVPRAVLRRRPRLLGGAHEPRRDGVQRRSAPLIWPACAASFVRHFGDADLARLADYWERLAAGRHDARRADRRATATARERRHRRRRRTGRAVLRPRAGGPRRGRPGARERRRPGRAPAHRRGGRLPARPWLPGAADRVPRSAPRARLRASGPAALLRRSAGPSSRRASPASPTHCGTRSTPRAACAQDPAASSTSCASRACAGASRAPPSTRCWRRRR